MRWVDPGEGGVVEGSPAQSHPKPVLARRQCDKGNPTQWFGYGHAPTPLCEVVSLQQADRPKAVLVAYCLEWVFLVRHRKQGGGSREGAEMPPTLM